MKLSTREDIEAPIDYVFAQVTDFAAFERRALRQGADVRRRGDGPVAVDAAWDIAFDLRGKPRQLTATLTDYDPPNSLQIRGVSDGMDAVTEIDLIALSQSRTRVMVGVELKARTLTARLLLQSMKLAKARLTKRFKGRVLDFCEDVEDRYRQEG